jgi:hypothetical protein
MIASSRRVVLAMGLLPALAVAACGGGAASSPTQTAPIGAPPETSGPSAAHAPSSAAITAMPSDPHTLAIAAAACWFGGVWGDALGESVEQRKANDEARCNDVVVRVWGQPDKVRYEMLRGLDGKAIENVVAKVGPDGAPGKLTRAFADAQKEALEARHAADRVKRDVVKEPDRLTKDEAAVVGALAASKALDALLKTDAGDLTHEVHALGLMTAMERLETSRGLPKHLKVYAMEGPVGLLFGVTAPAMPDDATKPLPRGAYLAYVEAAAKGAGHAVPDAAKTPKDRESLAWAGVHEGIADKLKADMSGISKDTALADVVAHAAQRLDAEFQAETNALATKAAAPAAPAPAAQKPQATPKAPAPAKPAAPPKK